MNIFFTFLLHLHIGCIPPLHVSTYHQNLSPQWWGRLWTLKLFWLNWKCFVWSRWTRGLLSAERERTNVLLFPKLSTRLRMCVWMLSKESFHWTKGMRTNTFRTVSRMDRENVLDSLIENERPRMNLSWKLDQQHQHQRQDVEKWCSLLPLRCPIRCFKKKTKTKWHLKRWSKWSQWQMIGTLLLLHLLRIGCRHGQKRGFQVFTILAFTTTSSGRRAEPYPTETVDG